MGMKTEINSAVRFLLRGGIILYPTDTIWGIGCDATLDDPVERIFSIKQRQDKKAMLVLVDSVGMLEQYVDIIPDLALEILALSEQPLTIVYPGAKGLAPNLIDPDGSVGIRITKDPFCKGLLQAFQKPIVSTSANIAGNPGPASYNQIIESIIASVDYAVDWRREDNTKRKPSGILKVGLNGEIEVIRE
jgi:L-threonylcarbamoyladenylate synthase